MPDARTGVWAALAAPLYATEEMDYDGASEDEAIRRRFDAVVPGDWDLTFDLLPSPQPCHFAFKCRVQVLGVIREAAASHSTYEAASDRAFKLAAERFGVVVTDNHA